MAVRNIIRQTVIVLPVLSIFLMYYSISKNNKNNFLIYDKLILLLIFISSFHPVYSKINIIEPLKKIINVY